MSCTCQNVLISFSPCAVVCPLFLSPGFVPASDWLAARSEREQQAGGALGTDTNCIAYEKMDDGKEESSFVHWVLLLECRPGIMDEFKERHGYRRKNVRVR